MIRRNYAILLKFLWKKKHENLYLLIDLKMDQFAASSFSIHVMNMHMVNIGYGYMASILLFISILINIWIHIHKSSYNYAYYCKTNVRKPFRSWYAAHRKYWYWFFSGIRRWTSSREIRTSRALESLYSKQITKLVSWINYPSNLVFTYCIAQPLHCWFGDRIEPNLVVSIRLLLSRLTLARCTSLLGDPEFKYLS